MSDTTIIGEWEIFHDESHFGLWAIRPVGDDDFNSPHLFHIDNYNEALALAILLDKTHRARLCKTSETGYLSSKFTN